MKSKQNNKYEIGKPEMSYSDVIMWNKQKFNRLGYEDDFQYRSKDKNKWGVSTFFLKGGKGKKEKFYNEKDSIIMDYKSITDVSSFLVKRNLFRKQVNDKKFVIISLPKYEMKDLYRFGLLWLSDGYHDENDSSTWFGSNGWDENNDVIEHGKIKEIIGYLPNKFRNGFFDIMDGRYFFIIPSQEVVYSTDFSLMMNVRGQEGENDSYNKTRVEGFLSTWVDVEVPVSVDVDDKDYRVISEKIHNYRNGTSKIEVSMSEMYKRLSNQTGDFYNSKTSGKEWFDEDFRMKGLQSKSTGNHMMSSSNPDYKGGVGISESFTDKWDGYGKYTPPLDESLDIEDNKKVEMVLDSLDERRKEVQKGFRKWKKDTSKRLDEIINHLQEGKKSLLENSKEIDKVLKEKVEYDTNLKQFRDSWVEDNLPNFQEGYRNSLQVPNKYQEFTKDLMVGKYKQDIGILTMLSVDTLKKMRTSGSPFFKDLLESSTIVDTSKSRNYYKDKLHLSYGKEDKVSQIIFGEFYGLGDEESLVSTPNEKRQMDYLQYGSNDYIVFFIERFVKLVIKELELFISNNKLKKNHNLYRDEIEDLKNKYLRDTNHFLDIPIPTLDKENENMELLSWMDDFSDKVTDMVGIKKIEIPTKPNPYKKEK
ncbi:hypothetical protein N9C41_00510 [Candidatus Marinimicrobia bacterium]|jgi:hypothetical protein|nr:hypothetical protein [Candidatus Neomarinimicrobiota bacterium]MDA9935045.1 hypothetical protein [Candidatus Neomarinimicrobiota bacterium]